MQCGEDNNYTIREWTNQRTINSSKSTIFLNWVGPKIINSHFGIVDGTAGVLYTNSTEMDDEGIYTCTVDQGRSQPGRQSAQLIVFGK